MKHLKKLKKKTTCSWIEDSAIRQHLSKLIYIYIFSQNENPTVIQIPTWFYNILGRKNDGKRLVFIDMKIYYKL